MLISFYFLFFLQAAALGEQENPDYEVDFILENIYI